MASLPVIRRELGRSARQPATYWLRFGGGATACTVFALTMLRLVEEGIPQASQARFLFLALHQYAFLAIWCVTPFLAADVLSRERREGTLGLLLLTPLRPLEVVVGKATSEALRAASLLLVVIPVMAAALLFGGVAWQELLMTLTLDAASLVLVLSVALFASAHARVFARAMLLSGALTLVCFGVLSATYSLAVRQEAGIPRGVPLGYRYLSSSYAARAVREGASLLTGSGNSWEWVLQQSQFGRWGPAPRAFTQERWCRVNADFLLGAAVAGLGLVRLAARRVQRTGLEHSAGPLPEGVDRTLTRPLLLKGALGSRMRRSLSRNPIGWLHERRAWARVSKWGWCALVAAAAGVLVQMESYYSFPGVFTALWVAVVVAMAFAASTGFRAELEDGVLELVLVTPLSAWQVIVGRLRAVWAQFLPSVALLAGTLLYLALAADWRASFGGTLCRWSLLLFLVNYALLPCVGMEFSLRRHAPVAAWLRTLLAGVVVPAVAGVGAAWLLPPLLEWASLRIAGGPAVSMGSGTYPLVPFFLGSWYSRLGSWVLYFSTTQAVLAAYSLVRLHRGLERRTFLAP